MKIIKLVTMCYVVILLCSKIQCMDEQKSEASDQPAHGSILNEIKSDSDTKSLTQHPGGQFKQDQASKHWAVQCQGCNIWLMSTRTPIEPEEKTINPTDEIMQRFHIKSCSWKPTY